jgi:hypothetical protein
MLGVARRRCLCGEDFVLNALARQTGDVVVCAGCGRAVRITFSPSRFVVTATCFVGTGALADMSAVADGSLRLLLYVGLVLLGFLGWCAALAATIEVAPVRPESDDGI